MRFLVRGRSRTDLDPEAQRRLGVAMNAFYTAPPEGVVLECDYILSDRSGSFSVLVVPDRAALDAVLGPFEGLVDLEVFEVITGAEAMGS